MSIRLHIRMTQPKRYFVKALCFGSRAITLAWAAGECVDPNRTAAGIDIRLSLRNIERAARLSPINGPQAAGLTRLFEKLAGGLDVHIVTLGGSMASGAGTCKLPCQGSQHAYTRHLCDRLNQQYPDATIRCENRAIGGSTTAGLLPMLMSLVMGAEGAVPDLAFFDCSENDAAESQDWGALTWAWRTVGQRSADHSTFSQEQTIFASTESLLRTILTSFPRMPFLMVESQHQSRSTFRGHRRAAVTYGVPFVSYLQAKVNRTDWHDVWPEIPDRWGGRVARAHPPEAAHRQIGEIIFHWLGGARARFGCSMASPDADVYLDDESNAIAFMATFPEPLAPKALVEQFHVCMAPLSSYVANDHGVLRATGALALPRVTRGSWHLMDDTRNNKLGWITSEPGSVLEFDLAFGSSPRVAMAYVRSYESFGDCTVGMLGSSRNFVLSGCCNEGQITQAKLEVMNVKQDQFQAGDAGVRGFGVKPFTNRTLTLTFSSKPGLKFKVLSVTSC